MNFFFLETKQLFGMNKKKMFFTNEKLQSISINDEMKKIVSEVHELTKKIKED